MMEKKYDYAVGFGGKVIYRGIRLFKGGPNFEVFYTGSNKWKENDDFSGDVKWLVSEEEALEAAIKLGMKKEEFYK